MPRRPPGQLKGLSKTDTRYAGNSNAMGRLMPEQRKAIADAPDATDVPRMFKEWGVPFIFTAPAQHRYTKFHEFEWESITRWEKVACSDEMFAIFNQNLTRRRRISTTEEDPCLMLHLIRSGWLHAQPEVVHRGETVEEYIGRGGTITTLPANTPTPEGVFNFKQNPFRTFIRSNVPK